MMPLPAIERLIDAFRKPKLQPREREALVVYLAETLRQHRSLNAAFFRLSHVMQIAGLRDDRERLAADWMARGMRYLEAESAEVREQLPAIVRSAAGGLPEASEAHCLALERIAAAGKAAFRALVDEASHENYLRAVGAFERAHGEWARAKKRLDRELNRTLSRYRVSGDEIRELEPPDSWRRSRS